jgi:AGZA family xanthine/uracil permease-like MFS transporter
VLLVLGGIALTGILVAARVRGAIIIVVVLLTLAGVFVANPAGKGTLTQLPSKLFDWPASLAPTFMKLDPGFVLREFSRAFPLVLALLFVDLFDNMGTLIAVCHRAGLVDERGDVPKVGRVLAANATAAMVGSALGTSTVTSYIESAAGIEAGGRTGLTALVVSGCFLLALFLHPLIRAVPAMATAPALVVVGVFMMQGIRHLDLTDFRVALPAVMTMVLMPLTFSISEGLSLGFLAYVLVNAAAGRARQLSAITYLLAAIFAVHLLLR